MVLDYHGTLIGIARRPGDPDGPLAWVLADDMFVAEMRASFIVSYEVLP